MVPTKAFDPSPYQQAIFDHVSDPTKGNLIVEAVAGSGKTTTITHATKFVPPENSILFAAFGKKNVEDLKPKMPKNATASTLNSVGSKVWSGFLGRWVPVNDQKTYQLLDEFFPHKELTHSVQQSLIEGYRRRVSDDAKLVRKYERSLNGKLKNALNDFKRLISMAKGAGLVPDMVRAKRPLRSLMQDTRDNWLLFIDSQDLDIERPDIAIEVGRRVLARSIETAGTEIDYDDQLYMPIIAGVGFPQYDRVFIDECFVGDTPITVSHDGSSMPIKQMVEDRYCGEVLSYNESTGETESKRVTGWHKIPSGKKLLKVRVRRCGFSKQGGRLSPLTERVRYGDRFVICTEDHKLFLNGKWTEARDAKPGDMAIVESCHKPVSSYVHGHKFSSKGKRSLSESMSKKNADPAFPRQSPPRGVFSGTRGGNGRTSPHEESLHARLGSDWVMQFPVPTRMPRDSGYPTCYKIDLADPERMIGVELDGHSHRARGAEDLKKQNLLESLGWTIIRLTNRDAASMSDELLNARVFNSPCPAEVLDIEEYTHEDPFVYDITVDGNHNFYADGVLAHNCQDLNAIQHAIVKEVVKEDGRIVAVGDRYQAIYAWRGSLSNSMDILRAELKAEELPLSICYRCGKKIVELAQTVVPHIKPHEQKGDGEIITVQSYNHKLFGPKDAVICRNVRPLVDLAYKLISAGVACRILNRNIEHGLVKLIKKMEAGSIPALLSKLSDYEATETAKLKAKRQNERAQGLSDRVETIRSLSARLSERMRTVDGLVETINRIFKMDKLREKEMLMLSTIHAAKGMEWDNVFILDRSRMPSKYATSPEALQQEKNIEYVAYTRAIKRLYFIESALFEEEGVKCVA